MASLISATSSQATLKVAPDELANVIKSLCEDAQVHEFLICTLVEEGRTMFTVSFDHSPSPDFEESKSYQLTELRRRGLLQY